MECGSSLLAISASFSPGFLRTHTPTTITDAVSQHPELFIIRDDSSLHRDSILLTMTFVLCRCPPSLNINLTEYIFNYTKLWVSNVAFVGLHAGLYNWKEVLFIYVIWSRRISHKKCRAKCLHRQVTQDQNFSWSGSSAQVGAECLKFRARALNSSQSLK